MDQAEKNAVMMTLAEMEDAKTRVDIYESTANTIMKRAAITGKMADSMAKEVARNT